MITIGTYQIDAAIREEFSGTNEITSHPVPRGADITDHIRRKPSAVLIEGVVSDTPIGDIAALRSETTLPSAEALAYLKSVRDQRQVVTIVASRDVYLNMALESITVPTDATTGDALSFTARFIEIHIADVDRVFVEVPADPRGKRKVNRGNKSTTTAPASAEPDRTVLQKMLKGVGFDTGRFAQGE